MQKRMEFESLYGDGNMELFFKVMSLSLILVPP